MLFRLIRMSLMEPIYQRVLKVGFFHLPVGIWFLMMIMDTQLKVVGRLVMGRIMAPDFQIQEILLHILMFGIIIIITTQCLLRLLLIFLGLLGTFWGLLGTISSIRETIDSLTVGSGDITHLFEDLKQGLSAPLGGMGTAFSSSLFGLAGSVILGFVDLQTGQAQSRFFNDLEDWLSGITKLSRGGGITLEGEADAAAVPAYVSALLEQTADSLDNLHKVISRSEEKRAEVNTALINLSGQISAMTDSQNENTAVLHRLVDVLTPQKDEDKDKTTATHLRNIDVQMKHLLEETVRGNTQLTDDLRAEFKLLARTLGAILDGRPHPATPEPSEPAPRPAKKPAEMDYEMPEPKPKADKKPIITPRPLRAKRDDD